MGLGSKTRSSSSSQTQTRKTDEKKDEKKDEKRAAAAEGKGTVEAAGENKETVNTPSFREPEKTQPEKKDGQSTLDKHLVPTDKPVDLDKSITPHLEDTLKTLTERLNKLASKEYIEEKFNKMITEDFLSNKLKKLETEVKKHVKQEIEKVNTTVVELKGKVGEAEKKVENLMNKVSDLEEDVRKIKAKNTDIEKKNKEILEQLEERVENLISMTEEFNNLEQYTRRNSIRIYGIDDKNQKETSTQTAEHVLKVIRNSLHLHTISMTDIDIAHRMGRFQTDGNRPIICKFVSRRTKHAVIKERKKLKGSGVVIKEDLTFRNAKLLADTKHLNMLKQLGQMRGKS